MLTEERRRIVVIARKMQGRKPRQALPGIQEPFGGGRPNRYLGAETHACPELLGFCYLIGPSLVISRETRKVARVARSRVLGKVLR